DAQVVHPRVPPPELSRALDFEPPLDRVEQVAFTARTTAESFIHALTAAGLTCTELRVELSGELDELVARSWLLPGGFDASAVIDRVRWQLQAAAGGPLRSRVTGLRLEPVMLDDVANQTPGLFGSGPDERVHHVLSRVQAMLGYEGVVTPRLCGGRWLAERQELVPWGERPAVASALERPWPGLVPDPLPALVFAEPLPVRLLAVDGAPVAIDGRGRLGGAPEVVEVLGDTYRVTQWAGPWPIDERPWDPQRHRVASRFQVVDETGGAWLLFLDGRGWWAEARYD
ncbi:MAG: DNA polymerase Y family protein, partial [Propionicimonas sp.]